jgi:hypothetical protein
VFSFFDPDSGSYRQLIAEIPELTVRRGSGTGEAIASRGEIQANTKDIAFLKMRRGRLEEAKPPLHRTGVFVALLALPLLLAPAGIAYGRRRERFLRDHGFARARRAARRPRRGSTGPRTGRRSPPTAFHEEVAGALVDYVADRANRPASGLTYDQLDDILAAKGCPRSRGAGIGLSGDLRFRALRPGLGTPASGLPSSSRRRARSCGARGGRMIRCVPWCSRSSSSCLAPRRRRRAESPEDSLRCGLPRLRPGHWDAAAGRISRSPALRLADWRLEYNLANAEYKRGRSERRSSTTSARALNPADPDDRRNLAIARQDPRRRRGRRRRRRASSRSGPLKTRSAFRLNSSCCWSASG